MSGVSRVKAGRRFQIEIIKPSHYDDDGYVIQWRRAFIPSNSLASVLALVEDVRDRGVLGPDIEFDVRPYDETCTVIPVRRIIRRFKEGRGPGLVMLTGVQTNQFPRAVDLAREFLAAGMRVAVGGFHVSGCLAMLPDVPDDIRAAQELGLVLFAGEAEGRMDGFLRDAWEDALEPVYNYMSDLPHLNGQVTPMLPRAMTKRYLHHTTFDAGRGCPFSCSFCTIINVPGTQIALARRRRCREASMMRLPTNEGDQPLFRHRRQLRAQQATGRPSSIG